MSPDEPPEDTTTTRAWWFSPMLQVVAGGVVIAFQWGLLTSGQANWLNWVVASLGLVILALGAWGWFTAWRKQAENDS